MLLFNLNLSHYFSTRSFCVFGLDLRVKMCLFLLFHSDKVTIAKQMAQKWLKQDAKRRYIPAVLDPIYTESLHMSWADRFSKKESVNASKKQIQLLKLPR